MGQPSPICLGDSSPGKALLALALVSGTGKGHPMTDEWVKSINYPHAYPGHPENASYSIVTRYYRYDRWVEWLEINATGEVIVTIVFCSR